MIVCKTLKLAVNLVIGKARKNKSLILFIATAFVLLPTFCFSQNKDSLFDKKHLWGKFGSYKLQINEKLTYSVTWNFINLGGATLEIMGVQNFGGRKACNARLTVTTKPFLSSAFEIAVLESSFDEESKASFKFNSKIKKSGETEEEVIVFNPVDQTFESRSNGKITKGTTAKHVQDILTSIYAIRSLDLKPGSVYDLKVHVEDTPYSITLKVLRKEKIRVAYGEFNCLVVEPLLKDNTKKLGLDGSKLLIWITDDKRRLPCYFKLDSQIGLIVVDLESVK